MTATPQPTWAPPPPRTWSAGRIVALVLGICLLLPGLGLLFGGGALLWADRSSRNAAGFLVSPADSFTTPGYALSSDRVNLATGADWLPVSVALGTVQVSVTGSGGSDVFVGIAAVGDASAYLTGVRHTVIRDLRIDASGTGVLVPGGPPAGAPADQNFWVSQASGSGTQQLSWSPAAGNWMLVVMNADASAGVAVQASIGATAPSLRGFGLGLLVTGLLLTVLGLVLVVLGARRRAVSPGAPATPVTAGTPGSPPAPGTAGAPGSPPVGWGVPAPRSGETPSSSAPPVRAPTRPPEQP